MSPYKKGRRWYTNITVRVETSHRLRIVKERLREISEGHVSWDDVLDYLLRRAPGKKCSRSGGLGKLPTVHCERCLHLVVTSQGWFTCDVLSELAETFREAWKAYHTGGSFRQYRRRCRMFVRR